MKWRKVLATGVWGVAFGALAVFARSRRKKRRAEVPQVIPRDIQSFTIQTEGLPLNYRGKAYLSQFVYQCQPTPFRVWTVLEVEKSEKDNNGGLRIFHVSPTAQFHDQEGSDMESYQEEEFYATIHVRCENKRKTLSEHLARGQYLEFRKCHVGGSMNGVATGALILTTTPVADFEFVMKPLQ